MTAVDDPVLYLASRSPRRQALLDQVGLRYALVTAAVEETPRPREASASFTARLAAAKARAGYRCAVAQAWPERPVLGADTCVCVDDRILGKPRDRDHFVEMLNLLSHRTHEVYTAIALVDREQCYTALSLSRVTFKRLGDAEIDAYWRTGEPRDKAGGYAIQGKAAAFVASLEGSYSGIVGLPLFEMRELLLEIGVDWL
ncbi:MAG: Maf family nucleotide pyrophosphatase [Gammaproteobacteria bacterium]|nr:Maf family nucleotide pyrophosphatase [Gammaproteobacteria bacterium]